MDQASLERWMKDFTEKVRETFGERLWFVGLQGSYARGEAKEDSDIDTVVILTETEPEDFWAYGRLLDELPYRDKACGFFSGKAELLSWEPSDLFQFCYDTVPVFGSLDTLKEKLTEEDVRRAVKTGACNIYHMCAHNMIHEKDREILKSLYKAAVFPLKAAAYLESGSYQRQWEELHSCLSGTDREILELGKRIREREGCLEEEFREWSERLILWAGGWIAEKIR